MSPVPQRAHVEAYLIRRLHEDVISDFAKGQSQVNDVILRAAALREIADVHHSSSAGPLCKLGTKGRAEPSKGHRFTPVQTFRTAIFPQIMPNGHL